MEHEGSWTGGLDKGKRVMKRLRRIVPVMFVLLPASALLADVPAGAEPEVMLQGDVLRLKCPGRISAVAFSPDGKSLAAGGSDKAIRVWAVGRTEPPWKLVEHEKEVLCLAFSPDGKRLASGSLDRRVRIFDVHQPRPVHTLSGHNGGVYAVAFSPDGKLLASGSADLSFQFWDPRKGKTLAQVASPAQRMIRCHADDQGRLYFRFGKRTPGGKPQDTLMRGFYGFAFSPDGKLLIATQEIPWGWIAWNIAAGTRNRRVLKRLQCLSWAAFAPDGQVVASTCAGGRGLITQSLATGKVMLRVELPKPSVRCPRYSSDGRTLSVLAGQDKKCSVYFVDATTGKLKRTINCPATVINSIDLSSDGRYLAAATDNGVLVWLLTEAELGSGAT